MKTRSRVLVVSAFLLFVATGCTVSRYYRAPDLEGQLRGMRTAIDGNLAKVDADYAEKQRFLETAKSSGADLSQAPFPPLAVQLEVLTKEKTRSHETANRVRAELDALSRHLAGRDRVTSDDPAFGQIQRFENSSEKLNAEVADAFGDYTESSRRFTELAKSTGLIPVDVSVLDGQLKKVIGEIESQTSVADKKISEAERRNTATENAKQADRKRILGAMRADLATIRGIRTDLQSFRSGFLAASKGKKTYLVSPQHPQYPLFQSLTAIQERINATVAAFNSKAESLNQ